jgi:hypothetical protein
VSPCPIWNRHPAQQSDNSRSKIQYSYSVRYYADARCTVM